VDGRPHPSRIRLSPMPIPPATLPDAGLRADCVRELFTVAESLRRTGRQRRLRDVTIVLPTDHTAVEAVELACLALAEGELSEAAADLDRFLHQLIGTRRWPSDSSSRSGGVVRRAGPGP